MIKRLRRKFVIINMSLLLALLTVILGLVYHFAAENMEDAATAALQLEASAEPRPGRPGTQGPAQIPCFTLELTPRGDLLAVGGEFYDLTDEAFLRQLYQKAQTGRVSGILKEYSLRYYRAGSRCAFADMSAERRMLDSLTHICVAVGIAAACAFLLISVLLARWAVRPVEQAWDQQRQFVADASHELKTPLTVILTNAELLRSPDYSEAEKSRFSENILTMSRHMRSLVEGLLELARGDNGQRPARMEPLELSALVEEAALIFEPVFFEAGRCLESTVESGIQVRGDTRQLKQVADILLDNACKYSAPGSTVQMTLSRQGRGKCLLTVVSQGKVLTARQCSDIFKRFYRVDTARSRDGSFGLGLSIARQLVAAHGGRIWAEGTDGRNTFFVSLPEG